MRSEEAAALGEELRCGFADFEAGFDCICAAMEAVVDAERLWGEVCEQFEALSRSLIEAFPNEGFAEEGTEYVENRFERASRKSESRPPERVSYQERPVREEAEAVNAGAHEARGDFDISAQDGPASIAESRRGEPQHRPEDAREKAPSARVGQSAVASGSPQPRADFSNMPAAHESEQWDQQTTISGSLPRAVTEVARVPSSKDLNELSRRITRSDGPRHAVAASPAQSTMEPIRGLRDLALDLESKEYTEMEPIPGKNEVRPPTPSSARSHRAQPSYGTINEFATLVERVKADDPLKAVSSEEPSGFAVGSTETEDAEDPDKIDVEKILEAISERIEEDYRRFYGS